MLYNYSCIILCIPFISQLCHYSRPYSFALLFFERSSAVVYRTKLNVLER
jgi:hypothetical protein